MYARFVGHVEMLPPLAGGKRGKKKVDPSRLFLLMRKPGWVLDWAANPRGLPGHRRADAKKPARWMGLIQSRGFSRALSQRVLQRRYDPLARVAGTLATRETRLD